MSFTTKDTFTFDNTAQASYPGWTPDQTKINLNARAEELRLALNAVVNILNSITAGSSGSENIASATIPGLTGNTIYSQIANLLAIAQAAQTGTIIPGTITDVMLSNTAGQLKDKVNIHLADLVMHLTSAERTAWNAKIGFIGTAVSGTVDLDTFTTPGVYEVDDTTNVLHKPPASTGVLEVFGMTNALYLIQRFTNISATTTAIYYRTKEAATWSPWIKMAQSLSGGNKIQSGMNMIEVVTAGTAVTNTIAFPTAFASVPNSVVAGLYGEASDAGYISVVVMSFTATTVTLKVNSYVAQPVGFYWIATGS